MAFTKTQVSELYVTLMGRASEAKGNQWWQDNFNDQTKAAAAMLGSDAVKAYFGDAITADADFIANIYKNTLNKSADGADGTIKDPAGIEYWTARLTGTTEGPQLSRAEMIVEFIKVANASTTVSGTQFSNRVSVSDYAAENLTDAPEGYQELLSFHNSGDEGLVVTDTATSVDFADGLIDTLSGVTSGAVNLTENPDTLSGNVFNAGRVWDPAGDDQLNSLNDDDILTGTGENPTLNVNFINDVDSGDMDVMPTLNNIETLNVKFSANANQTIDLQDTTGLKHANAERIDGGANVTFDNIQSVLETATVSNSNDNTTSNIVFDHSASVLSGDADEVALSLSNVQMNNLRIDGVTQGYEIINLDSSNSENTLNTMTAESLQTLNITGDASLRLGGMNNTFSGTLDEGDTYTPGLINVAGSLTKVDASALTASLTYHIGAEINAAADGTGANIELEVIGSAQDDTFVLTNGNNIDAVAGNTDKITGGEGSDTLIITGGAAQAIVTPADDNPNLTAIENLEIRSGQDNNLVPDIVSVDADAFDSSLASIYVRNEGQSIVTTVNTSGAEAMTTNLDDLSADLANGGHITIAGGTTGNNGMANNVLNMNLKDATDTSDSASINIATGINTATTDGRFNFELSVDGDNATKTPSEDAGAVENVTINDTDSESNTVRLVNVTEEIGTIEITGGSAGTFMNLDEDATAGAASNGGLYQYSATGNTTPTATAGAQAVTADGQQVTDMSAMATQARIVADTFDASTYSGNVVARFSTAQKDDGTPTATGGQNITTGTGDDTIIFDNLGDNRSGLTISDHVDAGAGTDTIVIDGNTNISLSASEWTNVTNFENIRLLGAGAGNSYNITITDDVISNNHGTNGLLNIINDNDSQNDIAGNLDGAAIATESAVTIDASSLSANSHFSYNGEEGSSATADRIIVSDANMNGQNIIDGGAMDNSADTNITASDVINNVTNTAALQNNDVLEILNKAVVTVGDLENIKNIGTLEFTTDKAVTQVSRLELNDTVVDSLVDSYHTSLSRGGVNVTTAGSPERLQINGIDSTSIASVATATVGLTVEAGTLTDKSDLDILLGRGANDITTGAGQDSVVLLGNYKAGTYTAVENNIALNDVSTADAAAAAPAARVVTDTINLNGGTDTLTTYGTIDITGATLAGIENFVANSDVTMTEAQYNSFTTVTFNGTAAHTLRVLSDDGDLTDIDASTILLTGGAAAPTFEQVDGNNPVDPVDPVDPDSIALTADTTAVDGVVENFTYAIDSSTADLISGLTADITLTGFTVGEDTLTFVDVAAGDATTAGFVDEVTVSTSAINNLTDIIFDANADGDAFQLTLTGIQDADLATVDMTVA
jgi:hypothetical protein